MVFHQGFYGPHSSEAGNTYTTPHNVLMSTMSFILFINCYYFYNYNDCSLSLSAVRTTGHYVGSVWAPKTDFFVRCREQANKKKKHRAR
jgi:hypothetical protein